MNLNKEFEWFKKFIASNDPRAKLFIWFVSAIFFTVVFTILLTVRYFINIPTLLGWLFYHTIVYFVAGLLVLSFKIFNKQLVRYIQYRINKKKELQEQ